MKLSSIFSACKGVFSLGSVRNIQNVVTDRVASIQDQLETIHPHTPISFEKKNGEITFSKAEAQEIDPYLYYLFKDDEFTDFTIEEVRKILLPDSRDRGYIIPVGKEGKFEVYLGGQRVKI